MQERIGALRYQVRMVKISDPLIAPGKVQAEQRENWNTEQIIELLLDKLYELYDGNYHPVLNILRSNEIKISEPDSRAIVKKLEGANYLDSIRAREIVAKLTIDGKIYVESQREVYKEDYSDLSSKPEMDQRIDEVLEKLNTLGLGQEILFEELQELKDLYTKLSKKTWGQLLKGKLIDLAIGKMVENDNIKYIYEHLTHHTLRLP